LTSLGGIDRYLRGGSRVLIHDARGPNPLNAVNVRAHTETAEQATGLAELYVRHAPGALRLAYMLTAQRELAEDLVQDAFVKLAGRFVHLRRREAFDAYLRRMIVNQFLSHLRRRRVERAYVAREGAAAPPEPSGSDLGERDQMWRALQQLPERQRAALVLRYYEDLSEREAAEILRCSTSALKSLVARGMDTLRGKIEEP
jgi:RNA polymerase sigma-70 factor (sigma-E family)